MALKNSKNYQGEISRNAGIFDIDQIQIETRASVPTDSDLVNGRMVYVTGTGFRFYANDSWFTVPISTSGGTGTWDSIYATDKTLTIDAGTLNFTGTHSSNAVFTVTGGGTGAAIQITSGSSGLDISGTSATWTVSKVGAALLTQIFLADNNELRFGNTVGSADAKIVWDTVLLNISGAVDFDNAVTMQSGFTLAAGDSVITDGSLTITDGDNAAALAIVNNTMSTDTSGIVTIDASSLTAGNALMITANALTTGSLLWLETSDAAMNGEYIYCYDGAAVDFSVGEDGRTVITGASGIQAFTISNGDTVIGDGSLTMTDGDNATAFSITADSVTSADTIFVSSDGLTSGSLMNLVSTGTLTTSGSILEITADSATTAGTGAVGRGIVTVSADALTTGTALDVTSTSIALTSGNIAHLSHVTGDITGTLNKTGFLVGIESFRTVTTGTVVDNYDALSIIRTSVINGGGAFTSTGSVLYIENVITNSSGTITDTATNGIEIVMDSLGSGDAINIIHSATAGRLLDMTSSATTLDGVVQITANSVNTGTVMVIDGNALTAGTLLELSTTGTLVTGGNEGEVLNVIANSATTATALIRASGTSLTDGWVMELTGGGSSSTASGGVVNIDASNATNGVALKIVTTGIYASASTGFIQFTADSATTGDILTISVDALTTGNAITVDRAGAGLISGGALYRANMGAAIAGSAFEAVTTGAYTGTDGILSIVANTATTGDIAVISATAKTTAGSILDLVATGGTMSTGDYLTCNDSSLDVFAVRRNGHLSSRQTTKPTVAVGTQNGLTNAAITAGSTDTVGIITTTGTSGSGDTIFTVTFEEAYAVAPVVQLTPANESASQSADDATSGAYVSATTTSTFVVTIPGASGATPSWYYHVMEMGS